MTRATVRYSRILVKLSGEALMGDGASRRRPVRHLERGRIRVFPAGPGNPCFPADTAEAVRAIEINAGVLLKATKVNGVYSDDPWGNPPARRYAHLTFDKVLADK